MKLRPYQQIGVRWLERTPHALLADDMGLGKTIQSLAASLKTKSYPILVVCPKSLVSHWGETFQSFYSSPVTDYIQVLTSQSQQRINPHAVLVICHYDILTYHEFQLSTFRFKTIILDEAHYIKNRTAKRTKSAFALAHIPKKILLTGTPMTNFPADLWALLAFMQVLPPEYRSYYAFTSRYAGGHYEYYGSRKVWTAKEATNTLELQAMMKPFILRRLKSEVLTELPSRSRETLHWNIVSSRYKKAQADFISWYIEESGKDLSDNPARYMVELNKLRQIAEEEKAETAIDFLSSYEQEDHPIVVFANHTDTLDTLKQAYPHAEVIEGGQTMLGRERAVTAWKHGDTPFLFANIAAGGQGLNLQHADTVLFLGYPWTPSAFSQAEDRIYRIGQSLPVTTYLSSAFPIDRYMGEMLTSKQEMFQSIFSASKMPFPQIAKNFVEMAKTC